MNPAFKKILSFCCVALLYVLSTAQLSAQVTYVITGDTIKFQSNRTNKNAILKIFDSTRNLYGPLSNQGNGVTHFQTFIDTVVAVGDSLRFYTSYAHNIYFTKSIKDSSSGGSLSIINVNANLPTIRVKGSPYTSNTGSIDVSLNNLARIPAGDTISWYGDSYVYGALSDGYGSGGGYGGPHAFANIVSSETNTYLDNAGKSFPGSSSDIIASLVVSSISTQSTRALVYLGGSNNIISHYNGATYEECKAGLRTILANQFLKTIQAPSTLSQTGTWTNTSSGSFPPHTSVKTFASGNGLKSAVLNSTLVATISGDNVIILTHGVDGTAIKGGIITVYKDTFTTPVGTYDNRGRASNIADPSSAFIDYTDSIVNDAIIFKGLGTGSHTITIKVTTLTSGGVVYIDGVGTLMAATECKPVIAMSLPFPSSYGMGLIGRTYNDFKKMDTSYLSVINEFANYPVFFGRTNDYADTSNIVAGDGFHGNNAWHYQIAQAVMSQISPNTGITNLNGVLKSGNTSDIGIFINMPADPHTNPNYGRLGIGLTQRTLGGFPDGSYGGDSAVFRMMGTLTSGAENLSRFKFGQYPMTQYPTSRNLDIRLYDTANNPLFSLNEEGLKSIGGNTDKAGRLWAYNSSGDFGALSCPGSTFVLSDLRSQASIAASNGIVLLTDGNVSTGGTNSITFRTGGYDVSNERLKVSSAGHIKFNNYGSGSITGTPAYALSVDASGNIIETTAGGGGSGTVTSVATNTGTGITGGTITSTGTLAIDTFKIATRLWRDKLADSLGVIIATKGTGTVTSVAKGYGLKADGTITATGTIALDTFVMATRSWRDKLADSLGVIIATKGPGTVTSVATTAATGIKGGTITGTGTLYLDTFIVSTRSWRDKLADSLGVILATKGTGNGTVTSIATTAATGIKGGTITGTGTLYLDTFIVSTRSWRDKLADSLGVIIATKGSGTVTSVAKGYGLKADGTITTTGTIALDTFVMATRSWRDKLADSLGVIIATKGTGNGSVTSVAKGIGLVADGSITTTGTINVDTFFMATRSWRDKLADSIGVILATKQSTTLSNGKFLVGNGSNVATAVSPSGDVTFDNTGAFAIGAGKVTNSMIANGTIDVTAKITGIQPSTNGGTGNGFFKVSGPASTEKTFTFPNASAVVLTDNAAVTVAQGGTGIATTTAYGIITGGTTSTGAFQNIGTGTSGKTLISQGSAALPIYGEGLSDELSALKNLGSGILGESIGIRISNLSGNVALASGTIRWTLMHVPQACTITGIKWNQVTQGVYTAATYNGIAMYSISAGTYTLVASSTDDGTIWKAAAGTIASKAFSSTYAAAAGDYIIAFLYQQSAQTTAPVVGSGPNLNSGVSALDMTNSYKLSSTLAGQTAFPSPTQAASGLTVGNAMVWAIFY